MLIMFNARDGMPMAFINDGFLQHMRVAGGAGLGVKYLARPDSHMVGMIGSGGMARTYLEAFAAVRQITKVKVYSPSQNNAKVYAKEMTEKFNIEVIPVGSAREAVKDVDIVSCCTSSIDPVFKTACEPGMHITDVTWDETEPGFANVVDVAIKMGESTRISRILQQGRSTLPTGFWVTLPASPKKRISFQSARRARFSTCPA